MNNRIRLLQMTGNLGGAPNGGSHSNFIGESTPIAEILSLGRDMENAALKQSLSDAESKIQALQSQLATSNGSNPQKETSSWLSTDVMLLTAGIILLLTFLR
ncbi:MAG: hypothetical protein AB7U05_08485 [Mangrovibacterium sp.]